MTDLIIGTANFGNSYGLTKGEVAKDSIQEILDLGMASGIKTLDTAYLYNNSYEVLSENNLANFGIITKTPKFSNCKTEDEAIRILQDFIDKTNNSFGLNNLKAILFHDSYDLSSEYGDLIYSRLKKEMDSNSVQIGISVYDVSELEIIKDYNIEIVQAPLNIFDQRFISSSVVELLQNNKIEFHSRSVFLQGLMLMNASQARRCNPGALKYIKKLDDICLSAGVTRLQLCLSFLKSLNCVTSCLVGINSLQNLSQIINIWNGEDPDRLLGVNYRDLNVNDDLIIDPRKWKKY